MKILVAEDDPLLSELLSIKLKKDSHDVFLARNGDEGLKLAREINPDAILLDLNMPVMDGFDALKILKNDAELKNIPVVIFSSLGEKEENLEKCKQLGADAFINKSQCSLGEVSKRIEDVLKNKMILRK